MQSPMYDYAGSDVKQPLQVVLELPNKRCQGSLHFELSSPNEKVNEEGLAPGVHYHDTRS